MNILITGANGFIGKNLISILKTFKNFNIFKYDIDCDLDLLDEYTKECDFVFHLAGVNRPRDEADFIKGNVNVINILLERLKKHGNKSPILISSSIQAEIDNPYGRNKKRGEEILLNYSKSQDVPIYIYRLPNVFGKWCRPNYNSVVATFCHNIANNLDITVNDSNAVITLVYIDDVVNEFVSKINNNFIKNEHYYKIEKEYKKTVGKIAKLLYSFKESRTTKEIVKLSDSFTKKLYATYLSYLPKNEFCYPLKMNIDERGSFTEFIRTPDRGQVSVNISKPGITKGNHWHHSKNEKFLVVKGNGIIKFRKIGENEIIEYRVNGQKLEVVDIPVGYTHNIVNTGNEDMVTIMWASEQFNPDKPDTILEEV